MVSLDIKRSPRRSTLLACLVVSVASACLHIDRTAPSGADSGPMSTEAGTPALDASDFVATPCQQACLDKTPAGEARFVQVAVCYSSTRLGACAQACAALTQETAVSSCAIPGVVDPNPACNACLKDACCSVLTQCLSDTACLTVGICASGCQPQ